VADHRRTVQSGLGDIAAQPRPPERRRVRRHGSGSPANRARCTRCTRVAASRFASGRHTSRTTAGRGSE
jgi:hypothetical protein